MAGINSSVFGFVAMKNCAVAVMIGSDVEFFLKASTTTPEY